VVLDNAKNCGGKIIMQFQARVSEAQCWTSIAQFASFQYMYEIQPRSKIKQHVPTTTR
jgi:hypothetical protein